MGEYQKTGNQAELPCLSLAQQVVLCRNLGARLESTVLDSAARPCEEQQVPHIKANHRLKGLESPEELGFSKDVLCSKPPTLTTSHQPSWS